MGIIGILQPGYIPWLGFFEQMSKCDIFVYLDDVQYTKRDWRNRNRIKTKDGIHWLTIPVSCKYDEVIKQVRIDNSSNWNRKHIQTLRSWYSKSNFYKMYSKELEIMLGKKWVYLVDLDMEIIRWLKEKLGLERQTVLSSELSINTDDKQLRMIEICKKLSCNHFYEGKSGQNYIDANLFETHGIAVEFQEYQHPYYNQLWMSEQGFISHLSVIDLLFNYGPDSLGILTGEKIIPKPQGIAVRHADNFKTS